jgi:hypothetical protein
VILATTLLGEPLRLSGKAATMSLMLKLRLCLSSLVCLAACTSQGISPEDASGPILVFDAQASDAQASDATGIGGAGGTTVPVSSGGAGGTTVPASSGGAGGVGSFDAGLDTTVGPVEVAGAVDAANVADAAGTTDAASAVDSMGAIDVVDAVGAVPDAWPAVIDAETGILVASVTRVQLGTVAVGTTASTTVTIMNIGAPTTLQIVSTNPYVSVSGCAGALPSAGFCTLAITVTPTAVGTIQGTVELRVPGGTNPGPLELLVEGLAASPGAFAISPSAIDLGVVAVGKTVSASVQVTALAAISGLSIAVSGPDLTLHPTSTCTSTLAAGTSCTVVATFSATTAHVATGDSIVVSQGGVTKAVPITANVIAGAKLTATPATAAWSASPGHSASSLAIAVANIGGMSTGPLTVALSGTNAADFQILQNQCSPGALGVGSYCVISVVFALPATAVTSETATLTITDQGPAGSSASVALRGDNTSVSARTSH